MKNKLNPTTLKPTIQLKLPNREVTLPSSKSNRHCGLVITARGIISVKICCPSTLNDQPKSFIRTEMALSLSQQYANFTGASTIDSK
jgi:hypothetical protein